MKRFPWKWTVAVVTALLVAAWFGPPAQGGASAEEPSVTTAGNATATGRPDVVYPVWTGKSLPLRDIARVIERPLTVQPPREINPIERRELPADSRPAPAPREDPLRQNFPGAAPMPPPIINIEGQSDDENEQTIGFRLVPPDTNGDVGPNHYVQWINLILSVYDKTDGSRVLGPIPGNAIFAGSGTICETTNNGDPTVLYDQFANRWVLSQFANPIGSGAMQCVAVSETSDPTGAYFLYAFPTPGNDYPKMGVWGDAYYMTYRDFFQPSPDFIEAVALERDKMLVGDPTAASVRIGIPDMPPDFFEGVLPPHIEGVIPSPGGAPAPYVMSFDDEAFSNSPDPNQDFYKIWHFSVDFANPGNSEITGPISLPTEEMNIVINGSIFAGGIDQPAPGELLDHLSLFTMWRAVYHGASDTLWVNNTVNAGDDIAGIRWAEIGAPTSATPTVNQAGTFAPADGEHRWMGSLAVDASGNMALGYSVSSTATFPSVRYAGRLVSDPPGILGQTETELFAGTGAQTASAGRWGDYSSMSIDESDGCTFWYTQEYYESTGSFDFKTRIGSFQFITCIAEEIGTLQGTVTDASTGDPIADATVEAVGTNTFSTTTDENGQYSMTVVADTYDVTASKFGFLPETVPGVVVTDGGVTTQDFALDPAPTATVSGTVTDGSGHSWPLYARIEVSGAPISDIFTNPASGAYSVDLPEGSTVTFVVNAVSPGYNTESREVTVGPGGQVEDFALTVDAGTCTAPGYTFVPAPGGFEDDFESGFGGWTLEGLWNPENEADACGSQVAPYPNPTNAAYYGQDGICDFNVGTNSGSLTQNTPVTIPEGATVLKFFSFEETECGGNCPFDNRFVEISTDGGASWQTLGEGDTEGVWYEPEFDLSAFAGQSAQVRFRFNSVDSILNAFFGWMVDDVRIAAFDCLPIPGGLLVGNVRDANTGQGLNDASVTSDNEPSDTTTTFGTPDDPNVDEGFYILFSSLTGMQPFTATKDLYGPDTQTPDVVADAVVVQDFNLPAGLIEADPTSIEIEVLLNSTETTILTLTNVGGVDATFEISDSATAGAASLELSLPASDGNFPRGEAEPSALAAPADGGPAPGAVPEVPEVELQVGSPAFSWNSQNGPYYTVFDLGVPEVLPLVTLFNPTGTFIGAGEFVDGSVFMIDGTFTMYEVDPATGDLLNTIPVTPPGGAQTYTGMALDPTTGTVFAASCDITTSRLFELDVASGEATLIGTISNSPCAIAIAVDGSGQMFAHDIVNDSLISIDKATAEGTIIGPLGFDANFGQGMGWDPATDTLFLAAFNNLAFQAELRAADRETGNTVLVGVLGQDDPGGLNQLSYLGLELAQDAPWLSENPTEGTVLAGGSFPIDIIFEATPANGITHPGDFTAELRVSTDTPTGVPPIPVIMTVPPDGFGTFKGSVLGPNGGPVPDATVEAIQGGEVIESTTTDVLGKYTLQIPPGTYELHAFKGNQEQTKTATVGPDQTVTVNFKITEGIGTFKGRVTGGPGGPVPDATVEALQDGVVIASTTTDAMGRYTLQVPAGTYDLHAFKGDREDTKTGVTVGADQTVTVNFKLR